MRFYIFLALAPLFWASNWVVGRGLHEIVPPVGLNFARWTVAFLVIAPWGVPRVIRAWPVVKQNWKVLGVLGLLGAGLFQTMIYLGLNFTTVINAVVINSTLSFFMLIISWLMLREPMTRLQLVGVLISFVGILVIVGRGDPAFVLDMHFGLGDLLILCAMPLWALYSVILKRWPPSLPAFETLTVISGIGFLVMLVLYTGDAVLFDRHLPLDDGRIWAAIAYVGIVPTIAAFFCWNEGIRGLGPNMASFLYPLMPVYGMVLAIIFLGEALHAYQVAALAIILVGVYLCTAFQPKRAGAARAPAPSRSRH